MSAIQSAVTLLKSWSRTRASTGTYEAPLGSYIVGLIVGFADGYGGQPYDDCYSRKHGFTICIPDAGASAYAAGYRNGYLSGEEEKKKIH
jgi:hypothetical protein